MFGRKVKTMQLRKTKGGKSLVMILAMVNTIAMVAVAGLLAYQHVKESKKEKLEDIVRGQAEGRGIASIEPNGGGEETISKVRVVGLDTFTANLANPRIVKYVRLRVEFELDETASERELERKKPQIKDEILSLLNGKRDQELLTADGKTFLKKEILNSVNAILETGKVKQVLFTDFLIN